MGNAALKQHYDTAGKTGVLQLSKRKLTELPAPLMALSEVLRNLDLSGNRLERLPEDITTFKVLKQLDVGGNRLERLPETIGNLVKLEMLNASNNRLTCLPASVSRIEHIKQLYLNNNRLTEFPLQLLGLKHLDVLELAGNKIATVPPGVSALYVTELNLNQNQVSTISEDLSRAPKLKILRLEENCLPLDAIKPSLLSDSKIHTLVVDGNLFESKQLASIEGYNEYMERFTAMKKKMF